MGNPNEAMSQMSSNNMPRSSSHSRATFSGATACIGVITLILSIVSVSVPHWGVYSPKAGNLANGYSSYQSGRFALTDTGTFGPFQVCEQHGYLRICHDTKKIDLEVWIVVAGICAIGTVLALSAFVLFSILHVSMQLQRREIWISFKRNIFMKLIMSAIAVVTTLAAVIFGGIEFGVANTGHLGKQIGVCYYIQIFLIFINLLLCILSYVSYKNSQRYPLNLVPQRAANYAYDQNGGGVSMTQNSGVPYTHGTPRLPIHPRPNPTVDAHTYATNAIGSYANGHTLPTVHFPTATQPGPQTPTVQNGGQNGFMAVGLHAAGNGNGVSPNSATGQPLPMQPIRIQTIQPNNHANPSHPMVNTTSHPTAASNPGININQLPQVLPTGRGGGVSFTPEGRGQHYNRMPHHGGSRESLDSNLSTISSNLSIGSTMSSGSGAGPLRSSLKKPKQKDLASVSSKTSSKRVQISIGSEQTAI